MSDIKINRRDYDEGNYTVNAVQHLYNNNGKYNE